MKKNGFTLIELLAVIVILAIIALIATPIVLNIIKGSKESATIRGAEYYLDAVELGVARNRLDNIKVEDGTYDILDTGNICLEGEVSSCTEQLQVDVKGEIPDSGTVTITNGKIVDINLTYDGKVVVKVQNELVISAFETDSWSTIIANVKAGKTDKYIVGAEKEITLTSTDDDSGNADGFTTGTYTVRLANKTTNDSEGVCANSTYSQTACGFVIEFVDIITTHNMNSAPEPGTNVGGWEASEMRSYVNGTIYNAIEDVVRNAIIDTRVVSGHEYIDEDEDGEMDEVANYTTTDKLYLLSTKEISGTAHTYDTLSDETRQLDYYTTNTDIGNRIKYINGSETLWWLRSANYLTANAFYRVIPNGGLNDSGTSNYINGVAPAFRIG